MNTTSIADEDFRDGNISISETEFYSRLDVGDVLKARFDMDAGQWSQIEYED